MFLLILLLRPTERGEGAIGGGKYVRTPVRLDKGGGVGGEGRVHMRVEKHQRERVDVGGGSEVEVRRKGVVEVPTPRSCVRLVGRVGLQELTTSREYPSSGPRDRIVTSVPSQMGRFGQRGFRTGGGE